MRLWPNWSSWTSVISRAEAVKKARKGAPRDLVNRSDAPAQCSRARGSDRGLAGPSAYAQAVPAALAQLSASEQLALRFFYSAAVLLQQQYADMLRPYVAERWQGLPDLFSQELGIAAQGTPQERLTRLGAAHRAYTRSVVNWTGTYDNVARKLLRRWNLEHRWNR